MSALIDTHTRKLRAKLLGTMLRTPGAVGILDVYAINSSVNNVVRKP